MVTKTNKYLVISSKSKSKTITARNIQEAYKKAGRLFPKTKLIQVSRLPAKSGREYESYYITR